MFLFLGTLFDVVSLPKKHTQLSISQWVKRLRECEHQLLGLCESRCVVSKIDRWRSFLYLWKLDLWFAWQFVNQKNQETISWCPFLRKGWLSYRPLCRIPDPHATKKCGIIKISGIQKLISWCGCLFSSETREKKLLCQHRLQSFFGTFEPCKRKTEGIWCLRSGETVTWSGHRSL